MEMILTFPPSCSTIAIKKIWPTVLYNSPRWAQKRGWLCFACWLNGAKGPEHRGNFRKVNLAGSTLNHHLATLETAGLVERVREGRHIRCRMVSPAMHGLVDYLTRKLLLRRYFMRHGHD